VRTIAPRADQKPPVRLIPTGFAGDEVGAAGRDEKTPVPVGVTTFRADATVAGPAVTPAPIVGAAAATWSATAGVLGDAPPAYSSLVT
jgi:hypothetical protein